MSIEISIQGKRAYAVGNTYAIKDAIKAIGGKWDPDAKAWWVGATKRSELEAVIAGPAQAAQEAQATLPALSGRMVAVGGNTYPVREQLRALGGSWDAAAKTWMIDEARLELAQAAVAKGSSEPAAPFRRYSCRECGSRPNSRGWPRIYRNGVCSDCYRDACDDY